MKRVKNLWNYFSLYEKIWFFGTIILALLFAVLFPEEDMNGVNGKIIMCLYLADTFLNVLCELLISKQSRWNFIVSLFVEVTEIALCIVTAARFSTMAVTLFFWIPVDIISFIFWNKNRDEERQDLTKVRKLSRGGAFALIIGIVVWTVVAGWFTSGLNISTDLFGGNIVAETIVDYLDACGAAIGVANGVFILLRYREQWIAWYIYTLLNIVIIILSGQYVLLVLELAFLTNSTYGYIKWTKYINEHKKL